jgi:hypothetical protein
MSNGHIASVVELPGISDNEAVETCRGLFETRKIKEKFEGFEVWDRARIIIQHPPRVVSIVDRLLPHSD